MPLFLKNQTLFFTSYCLAAFVIFCFFLFFFLCVSCALFIFDKHFAQTIWFFLSVYVFCVPLFFIWKACLIKKQNKKWQKKNHKTVDSICSAFTLYLFLRKLTILISNQENPSFENDTSDVHCLGHCLFFFCYLFGFFVVTCDMRVTHKKKQHK